MPGQGSGVQPVGNRCCESFYTDSLRSALAILFAAQWWVLMVRPVQVALAAASLILTAGGAAYAQIDETAPSLQPASYTNFIPAPALGGDDDTVSDGSATEQVPAPESLRGLVDAIVALPSIELTDDVRCLATAVYFESKGEPIEGQLAVAQVIMNRVQSGRYAGDVCGVIHQAGQFSFAHDGRSDRIADNRQWRTAQAVAVIAATRNWKDIVGTATAFHAARVSPKWDMKRVSRIGNHVFYASR